MGCLTIAIHYHFSNIDGVRKRTVIRRSLIGWIGLLLRYDPNLLINTEFPSHSTSPYLPKCVRQFEKPLYYSLFLPISIYYLS